MQSKLNLDFGQVERARHHAAKIAADVQDFIEAHTTVTVERTVTRLMGIDGVDDLGRPIPNRVVDQVFKAGRLSMGMAYHLGNAVVQTGLRPEEIGQRVADGSLDLTALPPADFDRVRQAAQDLAQEMAARIRGNRKTREAQIARLGEGGTPYLYVIVATGNIYEDVAQACAAARQGADIIAVIRSTAQSLLDYVPFGPTTEGFGGTYATQENFRIMRRALDETGEEIGRYIRLVNYCSGLCMPEIAAMGAMERLDVMLNDALYGILFRDINMKRTLVDQHFSRVINGYAGIIINTGEDNYLTTSDAFEEAHTVLASQFINEQFALLSGLEPSQMGLGHAFEMDPQLENGFLYELAQAQMAREIFPDAPLKYMPPTKHMTGNIFRGHVQDALFNAVSVMSGQGIQLLGMMTEAIHTPLLMDRALAIENARYVFRTMRGLGEEILFKEGGLIQQRAQDVLAEATVMLEAIEREGLMASLSRGRFAGVKRTEDGGKGLEGVVVKEAMYFNPFMEIMLERRAQDAEN